MEKVKIRSAGGWAKVLGTAICVGGSLIFTLWKGGYLFKSIMNKPLIELHSIKAPNGDYKNATGNWIKGAALITASNISWSLWLVLQAEVLKLYPARLSLNALVSFITLIQSCILVLFVERNPRAWKLGYGVELLTIIYTGAVVSGLVYYLQMWCISKKGPVFSSAFSPLLTVIVALFSAVAFAERLHLGSLIGAVLIILGLYAVLWGKTKDIITPGEAVEGKESADNDKMEILRNPATAETTWDMDRSLEP